MIQRNPANLIIKPEDIRPAHERYRVRGTFNPGAVKFGDETILLLRVAEDCLSHEGSVAVPYYRFENGHGFAEILEVKKNDPDVRLKDMRGVVYQGKKSLTSIP